MTQSYIYGPVPSRRLGISLGIDLVPFKVCSYDCIYCQVGRTTTKTLERKEWVPLDAVLSELKDTLLSQPQPDYITLSGSGEPTLHSRIGELIVTLQSMTDIPVAVLTNGSLLWDPQVRKELSQADLVVPSLDAGDSSLFKYVNRPHKDISFEKMVEGLIQFRKEYSGHIWLEVLLLQGVTALRSEVEKIASIIERIDPDRIQINTVTRPALEEFAAAVPREELEDIARVFGDRAEVISEFIDTGFRKIITAHKEDILAMLARRPCTLRDISDGLGMHPNEVLKYIQQLSGEEILTSETRNNNIYYKTIKA